MDPVLSNFILTLIGVGIGAIISLIGALSKCMTKSRCSKIDCCCGAVECIREPIPGGVSAEALEPEKEEQVLRHLELNNKL